MTNPEPTVVFFYCGNYSEEENKMVWKQNGKLWTLALKMPTLDVTYLELLSGIFRKLGKNEATTKLKMSYIPFLFDYDTPYYILEDDDVLGFLTSYKDQCRNVLHVEVVELKGETSGLEGEPSGLVEIHNATMENEEVYVGNDEINIENDRMNVENDEEGNEDCLDCLVLGEPTTERASGACAGGEWDDGIDLTVLQEFGEKEVVFDIVHKGSLKNCFEFSVIKSDRKRLVLKCREWKNGCKWALRAAKLTNASSFSVRKYYKMHSCSRASTATTRRRRRGTTRMIAGMLQRDFAGRFDTPPPKSLIAMAITDLGVKVSYSTAWRGRIRAANYVRGSPRQSYAMLYSYLHMLKQLNPGTEVFVKKDKYHRFQFLFFALGACIEGFRVMRKVLVIDAAHLKTGSGGVLCVVTAQDGNHHNYPIAFGIIDGEKDPSWKWFIYALRNVVPDTADLVFMSDRNLPLANAIKQAYPLAKHGYCNFHLAQNVKTRCKTNRKDVVAKFIECSKAYTTSEFRTLYAAFGRRYPSAVEYLETNQPPILPEKWARCLFRGDRYNIDSSNPVESVNAVLVEARKRTVLPMIDAIVQKVADWFCEHRMSSAELLRSPQTIVPFVDNVISELCVEAVKLIVSELNIFSKQYSVLGSDGRTYVVDLIKKSCTCMHFDIDKYPCLHGVAAAMKAQVRLDTLCSEYYLVETWAHAYTRTIYPVSHSSEWTVREEIRNTITLPPNFAKKQTKGGRKLEKRLSSVGEFSRRRRRTGRRRPARRTSGWARFFEPSVGSQG